MTKKFSLSDIVAVLLLGLVSYAMIAFIAHATYWDTGYQDWMYQAFRIRTLQLHGLISWDHVWSNGISYWKAYQIVPSYMVAGFASIAHLSVPRAMVIAGVGAFVGLRLLIYGMGRMWGFSPLVSFLLAMVSFEFTGYWNQLKDYNIAFSAPFVPLMLLLWRQGFSSLRARYLYAFLTGLSLFIHPLLACTLGGLWLVSALWQLDTFKKRQFIVEGGLMLAIGSFYAYSLLFLDRSAAAQYQLTHDFIVTLSGASEMGAIYAAILVFCWGCFMVRSSFLSRAGRLLLLYCSILWLIIYLNVNTTYVDFLNRLQIDRAGYFVAVGLLLPFGEIVQAFLKLLRGSWFRLVPFALIAYLLGIGFYAASTYAPSPRQDFPDPVQSFFQDHASPTGTVYIADSLVSSLNRPDIRFTNGYNEHLLPQFLAIRLRDLLTTPALSYRPTQKEIASVNQYAEVLGTQYLFLPKSSPYVAELTSDTVGYQVVAEENSTTYEMVVLSPPWQARSGGFLTADQALAAQTCAPQHGSDDNEYYRQLDTCVAQLASTLYSSETPAVGVAYPAADQLLIDTGFGGTERWMYVDESYSKDWQIPQGVRLVKSGEGMMLVHADAGVSGNITLRHTWGKFLLPYQLLLAALTFFLLILLYKPNILRSSHHG